MKDDKEKYIEDDIPSDDDEDEDLDGNKPYRFMKLKEGVSWLNAFNIFFTYFVGISQITFFDLCLVYLLKDEKYFNKDEQSVTHYSADIVFYSQPFTLVFDIIIGYMHDKIGRKWTLFLSTLVCSLAFFILPWVGSIYPGLLSLRVLLNFSLKGPLTAPLSADYVVASTRGKAVALSGLGSGIGAIFAVFVLFSLTQKMAYTIAFPICGGLYVLFAVFMLFTVKDVKLDQREESLISDTFSCRSMKETTMRVIKISKVSRDINLSYYGSFITRMGDILTILFLNLWVSSFYGSSDDEIEKAQAKAQTITGIGGVVLLLVCFFVGWGTDKISMSFTLIFYYSIQALFYFLVIFAKNPTTVQAFLILMFMYTVNGCLNIIINCYFYKSIKKEYKGTVSGVYLFFGTAGVMLISKLGSYFFEHVTKSGPFLLGGAFDVSFVILIVVFKIIF